MSDPIYVYVVEQGEYSSRSIVGVYATPEGAMADHPVGPTMTAANIRRTDGTYGPGRLGWVADSGAEPGCSWENGGDWDDRKVITRYEVQGG